MIVKVLGSGTSHGVPMVGCTCEVCTSDDPRDKRNRPSIHVQFDDGCAILIDTPPELRLQCLQHDISRCNVVLLTHQHADHIMGMDDLRRFNWMQREVIPVHGMPQTLDAVRRVFSYVFEVDPESMSSRPALDLFEIDGPFEIGGHPVVPIPLMHGKMPVLGFRFGPFAYCTDVNFISDASLKLLEGLEVLILDGLRYKPHPMHFNIEEAVTWAGRIGANETYLTHLTHDILHARTEAELPEGVRLAYDGLEFTFLP